MSHTRNRLRIRRNGAVRRNGQSPLQIKGNTARGARVSVEELCAALAKKAASEPSDAAELATMIEEDYQFAFVRRVLVAHLSVAPITCAPEDETNPRAVELAAALLELWQRHLSQIADAYGAGRAAFAIEWEFDADHVIHRPKLHSIPFVESSPKWDEETGQFKGIEIVGTELTLPPGQCWHCPTDADALHPHGRSRYIGAPRAEFDRRRNLLELYNEHIEHFALRGGVAYGPGTAVGTDGEEIDLAANMQAAHRARRPGTLLYVEGERGADGRYPQEFVEPPSLDPPDPIDTALERSDIRVLRSQGLSELSVQQTGDLGSYALAVVHRLVTLSVVYELAGQWGGSYGRYVADVAARFNLGRESGIKFDTPRLTELPDSAVADLAKAIVQQPDLSPVAAAIDLRRLLESGGVPVGDDFEDRLAKAMAERKAAQTPLNIPGASPFAQDVGAVALNCGNGPGGFQKGNKCQKGGSGPGGRYIKGDTSDDEGRLNGYRIDDPEGPKIELAADPGEVMDVEPAVGGLGAKQLARDLSNGEITREQLIEDLSEGNIEPADVLKNGNKANRRFDRWADRVADENDLINGEHFEDHANRMAWAWAPPPEEIVDALEELAKELKKPKAAAMADEPSRATTAQRLDPDATPAGVPSLDAFWSQTQAEIGAIYDEIAELIAARPDIAFHPTERLRELLADIDRLISEAAAAASLIGRAVVPMPPVRLPSAIVLDNPITGRTKNRWPWLDTLVNWLTERRLLTPDEFQQIPTADRSRNVSLPSVESPKTLEKIQKHLADAIAEGLPPEEFRARVKEIATIPRHEAETLVRTTTKQGYLDGKQATLNKPSVALAYPYDLLVSTRDTRVRETHKPLDGLIVARGSAAHAEAMRLLSDYNCRCDAIPLTEERAREEARKPGRRLVDALPAETREA